MAKVKIGWDGPLKVRYQYHLPELMSAIRRNAPVGRHDHDKISEGRYSAPGFPRSGGRLQRELGKLSNYKAPTGQNRVEITVDLPYARIIDMGGPVSAVMGRKMLWHAGKGDVFATQRVGFTIRGSGYVEKGFAEWADYPVSRGIVPEWDDGR